MKFFKSGCKFEIVGVNQEKTFNEISEKYKLYDIERISHTHTFFSCKITKSASLNKELLERGFEVKSKNEFGILKFFKYILLSYGLICGFFCGLILYMVMSNFVLNIEILGLESITKNEIYSILKQQNISRFSMKKNINVNVLSQTLLKKNSNLSLASVIIKGNTLVVNLKEKVVNEEVENLEEFQPLKSKFNGQITSIKLIQGTLKVSVGDIVMQGQVLVEPYITDSSNNQRPVNPLAEIEAKVWYTFKTEHVESRLENVRTGRKQQFTKLTFLNLSLNNVEQLCKFDSYELEVESKCISVNNLLPIYRHIYTYYEMKTKVVEEPYEENKEKIFENTRKKSLLYLNKCDIINKEYFNESENDGKHIVEYVVEVIKRIDRENQNEN